MSKLSRNNLIQLAAITVVFAYLLMAGGRLNGLVLYRAVSLSLGLLALVGAVWLGQAWYGGRAVALSSVRLALVGFLAMYGVTAALSIDSRRSLNALVLNGLYGLIFVLASDLIRRGWSAELFTRVMTITATIVIGLALWQTVRYELNWLSLVEDAPLLPPTLVRPRLLLTHANLVAAFLNLLWPIVLVKAMSSKSWPGRVAAAGWLGLAGLTILLTSSRGGWLGSAAALFVTPTLWWFGAKERSQQGRHWVERLSKRMPIIGATILALLALVGVAAAWLFKKSAARGSGLSARLHFWRAAWKAFVLRPVTGLGPDGYVTAYLRQLSTPPRPLYDHAHSVVMNVLAESGVLGILGGAALLLALSWAGWRRWREADASQRCLLAGIVGALTATAVHSLFDVPMALPLNGMVMAVLAAILATGSEPGYEARRPVLSRLIPTVMVLALLAAGVWSQWAYRPFHQGIVMGTIGDWEAAAPKLEMAEARDPGHTFYDLTSGYAHGVLAHQGDAGALSTAVRRYEEGITREPGYGLNHANLAALYWQQGRKEAALEAAARAVEAAPQGATFWLNLGFYQEEMGNRPGARDAYSQTLDLESSWATAYYWRATPFRRSVVEAWRAGRASEEPQGTRGAAHMALSTGRHQEALELFDQALAEDAQWVGGYLGRAQVLLGLGRLEAAAREARKASFLGRLEPAARLRADWLLATVAHRQGDLDSALAQAERALDGFRHQSIAGPGTYGSSIYGWAVFHRLALPCDVLPQVVTIHFTEREIGWLVTLGSWYEEADDREAARRVYEEALEAAPDCTAARARLAALGDE